MYRTNNLRILLSVLIYGIMLSGSGLAQSREYTELPGKRTDIGGFCLHFISQGSGDCTALFFHGEGDIALVWNLVIPEAGKIVRAVAVDEHGMGWSDYGHAPNTLRQQAYDFRKLLDRENIKGPFIVVGHSKGGLTALNFAKQFRDETAGVILVDSSHPGFMLRYRQKDGSFRWQKVRERAKHSDIPEIKTGGLTVEYEMRSFESSRDTETVYAKFPEADRKFFDSFYNGTQYYPVGMKSMFAEELQHMYENRKSYHLGSIPLVVISAEKKRKLPDDSYTEEMLIAESERLQKDLLSFSGNSRHIIARGSGHAVHIDRPDIIIRELKEIIEEIRK